MGKPNTEEYVAVHKGPGVFEDELLSMPEAARILAMSVKGVCDEVYRGRLYCEEGSRFSPDSYVLARDVLALGIRNGLSTRGIVDRLRGLRDESVSFGEIFRWSLLGLDLIWLLNPSLPEDLQRRG